MNIGQAARRAGISSKMIRYYEEIGLIGPAPRSDAGYRMYTERDLKTLSFIRHARELGFSSEQMKELVSLWQNTGRHSAEVKQLAQKHMDELNHRIRTMQDMVNVLQQSVACCAGDQNPDCTILNQLEKGMEVSVVRDSSQ
ncbi:Cu(I)-responsive transcriptional regulator [Acinetobacter sp. WZC-1]|uniref:Cu(I)-responsive transcriptional regulator n=1 Tax=Acinetobacter sp. WZC-1 TaxID=3459034 RepID=UPI00403D8A45